MLKVWDGVRIERVVDRAGACVAEHAHDWPVLCVHVMGGYDNHTELGECRLDGPSAILYRAGARHKNVVASHGFEQIEIEFDADWLGAGLLPDAPCTLWRIIEPAASRTLRTRATSGSSEQLRAAMRDFLSSRDDKKPRRPPDWFNIARARLREDHALRACQLAGELGLHPSWFGAAFKAFTGETVPEHAARLRVEHAAFMLRETNAPLVSIALDAGFCDQSHMNRSFQRVLARSPLDVRSDRAGFREGSIAARH